MNVFSGKATEVILRKKSLYQENYVSLQDKGLSQCPKAYNPFCSDFCETSSYFASVVSEEASPGNGRTGF